VSVKVLYAPEIPSEVGSACSRPAGVSASCAGVNPNSLPKLLAILFTPLSKGDFAISSGDCAAGGLNGLILNGPGKAGGAVGGVTVGGANGPGPIGGANGPGPTGGVAGPGPGKPNGSGNGRGPGNGPPIGHPSCGQQVGAPVDGSSEHPLAHVLVCVEPFNSIQVFLVNGALLQCPTGVTRSPSPLQNGGDTLNSNGSLQSAGGQVGPISHPAGEQQVGVPDASLQPLVQVLLFSLISQVPSVFPVGISQNATGFNLSSPSQVGESTSKSGGTQSPSPVHTAPGGVEIVQPPVGQQPATPVKISTSHPSEQVVLISLELQELGTGIVSQNPSGVIKSSPSQEGSGIIKNGSTQLASFKQAIPGSGEQPLLVQQTASPEGSN
jgi:hypothetical protein